MRGCHALTFLSLLTLAGCGPALLNGNKRCATTCRGSPTSYSALGCGLESGPYLICNKTQFLDLASNTSAWSKAHKLMVDIDLSDRSAANFTLIGNSTTPFSGSFDGNGKTISNLTYSSASSTNVGLFGYIKGARAKVKNLILSNLNFTGQSRVGTLAGELFSGSVLFVRATGGSATASSNYAGGLIGYSEYGALIGTSSSSATVGSSAANGRGGLVGGAQFTSIFNSFATGSVTGSQRVGGLAGETQQGVWIGNSYATGAVTGVSANVGGLTGLVNQTYVFNSFATGAVNSPGGNATNTGNLTGATTTSLFSNSFYFNSCTNGAACMADPAGVSAATGVSDFYNNTIAPTSSWNFTQTWAANSGTYPTPSPVIFDRGAWDGCSANVSATPFAAGNGTLESPYMLCTGAQLKTLMTNNTYWDKGYAFRMAADINLQGLSGITVIGGNAPRADLHFDGDGHTISNYSYASVGTGGAGLFGSLGGSYGGGSVRNLGLASATVTQTAASGTGTLVGAVLYSAVLTSWSTGTVTGLSANPTPLGGLVGDGGAGPIFDSYTTVTVSNAFAVAGPVNSGALVGVGNPTYPAPNSFSTGNISINTATGGDTTVGGCVGTGAISCYYSGTCSNTGAGLTCNAIGTSLSASDFTDSSKTPTSAWDFNRIWKSNPGALPTLRQWGEY